MTSSHDASPEPPVSEAACWYRIPWWEALLLIALLAGGLALRLDHLKNPITDHISFRQGTEAMMARDFHRNGTPIQYPRVMGYSGGHRIWVNEFPLYPYSLSRIYRFFGEDIRVGRILTLCFSLGTGLVIFFLLKTEFRNTVPLWGLLFFLCSPLGTYVGRTVIRHPMAFFFQVLALFLWVLWLKKPRWWWWAGTWGAAAITILMNFPNAYVGIPMVLALLFYRGWRGFADRRVWILAGAALLPSILWLMHALEFGAAFLAESEGNIKQRDLERFLHLEWVNAQFFARMWEGLWVQLLTPTGFIFAALGLGALGRSRMAWIARAYLGAGLLYLCFDHYVIYINPHDYYFIHLLVPAALCAGIAAGTAVDFTKRLMPSHPQVMTLCSSVLIALAASATFRTNYLPLREQWMVTEPGWSQQWISAGKKVQELTEPESLVVLDRAEDALIYYCDRPGWVNQPEKLTEEAFKSLVANGADYLVLTLYQMEGDRFTGYNFDNPASPFYSPGSTWVRQNGVVVHEGSVFQIIDLQPEKHGREKPAPAQEASQNG